MVQPQGGVTQRREAAVKLTDVGPMVTLVAILVLSYGYEIFNWNLTLDEPPFGNDGVRSRMMLWLGHGRWAMAMVTALQPDDVIPAMSTALGVALSAAALWYFARQVVRLDAWPAAILTGLGVVLPSYALHLSFMINAFGLGVGAVAVAGSGLAAIQPGRHSALLAVGLGTFAVGCYDGFVFALVVVFAAVLTQEPTGRRAAGLIGLLAAIGAVALPLRWASQKISGTDGAYTDSVLQFDELRAHPLGRLASGVTRTLDAVLPGGGLINRASPWLALLIAAALVTLVYALVRRRTTGRLWFGLALVAMLTAPVAAATAAHNLPFRSMVSLPFLLVCLLGLAWKSVAPVRLAWVQWAVVAVTGLALLGVMTATNKVLAGVEPRLVADRYLAMRIDEEIRLLDPARPAGTNTPILVAPRVAWPPSDLVPPIENIGISLFSGELWRSVSFLRSQGVPVISPPQAQREALATALSQVPPYPSPGWVQEVDGVVLINLGPQDTEAGATN